MKEVPLHEAKDDLFPYLRDAEKEEIVITRPGKPAGVLIGFSSEDDWFEYRLSTIRDFFAGSLRHVAVSLLGWESSSRRADL